MKIEDCEVGMKLKNCYKGEIPEEDRFGIISEVKEETIKFGYSEDEFNPAYYEPVNKFEIGDEVIFKEYEKQYKAEIFGLTRNKTKEVASIKFESDNEYHFRIILDIDFYLSPLKNKDELEVGDKFVSYSTDRQTYKVLSVEFDEHLDDKVYIAKTISEYHYGKIRVLDTSCVKEIIYD